MDRDEVELLLQGWGTWARDDRPPGWSPRCGSMEGHFSSPGDGDPRPIEIPEPIAEMVDAAIARVPLHAQDLLIAHFVRGLSATALGGQMVVDAAVRAVGDRLRGWSDRRWRGDQQSTEGRVAAG